LSWDRSTIQFAVVFFGDDFVADGHAHARALADGFGGEEGVEDFGLNFGGNAAAVIGNFDLRPPIDHTGADGNLAGAFLG
jgi:hypothetical protein